MTNDLRLLAHLGEVLEPSERGQVGSSAMAYKRNPMLAERIASLARLVSAFARAVDWTAATQWFERTLDDSAARRVAVPEAFLAADGMLRVLIHAARGLTVVPAKIEARVAENLAATATEEIMMEGVRRGGDRQVLHERIRVHSRAGDDLWARLKGDRVFAWLPPNITDLISPERFAGRAASQTREFLRRTVEPALRGVRRVSVDLSV